MSRIRGWLPVAQNVKDRAIGQACVHSSQFEGLRAR